MGKRQNSANAEEYIGTQDDKDLATGPQLWRLNQLGLLTPQRLAFADASQLISDAKEKRLF